MPSTSADSLPLRTESPGWRFAVAASILGWVLDAFNFFVVVFLFEPLADSFHVSKAAIVFSLTVTLALRPVGALLFGVMADRYGRKGPLIACVLFFTAFTIWSGYASSYKLFLLMRALYGIGMGGYWGIGASYAMESSPRRYRGLVSGLLQGGYPFGYLLTALAMQMLVPLVGWRAMFFVGCPVTAAIVILTLFAPESDSWMLHRSPGLGTIASTLGRHLPLFVYVLLMMTAMNSLSHGSQDLYPNFLKSNPALTGSTILGMHLVYGIPVVYNVGAVLGALFFGHISGRIGRRRALLIALFLCIISIPGWAFGGSLAALLAGSFIMQMGVQGAFGVIPAHLTELSPDSVRSLFPGLVYQIGVLLSSPAVTLEFSLRDRIGYPWALTVFEATVIAALLCLFAFGPEKTGRDFHRTDDDTVAPPPSTTLQLERIL
ncbi:MAG TPA: MFS transporter [Terracidiphilus sp.]|jgi:SHS family lactate transporter-like MFS transporter